MEASSGPEYIVRFGQIKCRDTTRVGGKGANLGHLVRAGFPVPPGIVITTQAFNDFLDQPLNPYVANATTSTIETHNPTIGPVVPMTVRDWVMMLVFQWVESKTGDKGITALTTRIMEVLQSDQISIPPSVRKAILDAVDTNLGGTVHRYAVRSSGVDEDCDYSSFAGQHDTVLNVPYGNEFGTGPLLAAIKQVWASALSERALRYRFDILRQTGPMRPGMSVELKIPLLAVIVQQMVPEVHAAGVISTCDPVSQDRRVVVIEACYGLGDPLVSGYVQPDRYRIRTRTRLHRHAGVTQPFWTEARLIEARVGSKAIKMIARDGPGVQQQSTGRSSRLYCRLEAVRPEAQHEQALTDEVILHTARTARRIERYMSCLRHIVTFPPPHERCHEACPWTHDSPTRAQRRCHGISYVLPFPQEIEWAWSPAVGLVLLQARPMTGLFPLIRPSPEWGRWAVEENPEILANDRILLEMREKLPGEEDPQPKLFLEDHPSTRNDPCHEPPLRLFASGDYSQSNTQAKYPLGTSIFAALNRSVGTQVRDVGGHLYYDCSEIGPTSRAVMPGRADPVTAEVVRLVFEDPAVSARCPTSFTQTVRTWLRTWLPFAIHSPLILMSRARVQQLAARSWEGILHLQRRLDMTIAPVDSPEAIPWDFPRLVDEILDNHMNLSSPFFKEKFFVFLAGTSASAALRDHLKKWVRCNDIGTALCDAEALERGILNNVTTQMNLAIAELVRCLEPIRALFLRLMNATTTASPLPDAFPPSNIESYMNAEAMGWWLPMRDALVREGGTAGQEFLRLFELFLSRFGFRGPGELDICADRFVENPMPLLQVIRGALLEEPTRGDTREDALAAQQHMEIEAERAAARLELAVWAGAGIFAKCSGIAYLRLIKLRRYIHAVRATIGLRELPKFLVMMGGWAIKRVYLRFGDHLKRESVLREERDVFHFSHGELRDIAHTIVQLAQAGVPARYMNVERFASLRARKFKRELAGNTSPPRVITSEGEIFRATAPPCPALDSDGHMLLRGLGVSAGSVECSVCIVHDPAQTTLPRGACLVARAADPGWTPLFLNSSAVILEAGGLLSHAGQIAREMGVPCVVGVVGAMERLKTGMRIRVEGSLGAIEVLDETPRAP